MLTLLLRLFGFFLSSSFFFALSLSVDTRYHQARFHSTSLLRVSYSYFLSLSLFLFLSFNFNETGRILPNSSLLGTLPRATN